MLTTTRSACRQLPVDDLFAADPARFEHLSREFDGLLLDFSRQRLDGAALDALIALAEAVDLRGQVDALLGGALVNNTEGRAALHTLLRVPAGATVPAALEPLHAEVLDERAKCAAFVRDIHEGRRKGSTGQRFTDVVNIGIGGSDLGPAMAVEALRPFHTGHVRCHFVSNVDGVQFADLVERARSRADAGHHLFQDLHHAGDAGQRAPGAALAGGQAGGRRGA